MKIINIILLTFFMQSCFALNNSSFIYYGSIKFEVPKDRAIGIAANVNGAGLQLCKKSVCGSGDLLVMDITKNHITDFKPFYQKLNIKKPLELFKLLQSENNKTLDIVSNVLGIINKKDLHYFEKGKIAIFWVQNKQQTGLNTLYIIKGDELYTLTGDFDLELVNMVERSLSDSY